jgi:predicted nuclease with TOPRIM domain
MKKQQLRKDLLEINNQIFTSTNYDRADLVMKRVAKALLNALSPKQKKSQLAETLRTIIEEMRIVQQRRIERNKKKQDKVKKLKRRLKEYKQDLRELIEIKDLFDNSNDALEQIESELKL